MPTPAAGRPDAKRREPLWDRVDRNRFRLVVYLAAFALITSTFIAVGLYLFAAVLAIAPAVRPLEPLAPWVRWVLGAGLWRPWVIGLAGSVLYEAWALARSEKWLLKRLRASFVPKGELLPTKMALKDMAIAAGLPVAPALYTLDTTNVNAFVYKAPARRPVLGVTEGLVSRLTIAEQRAVFANLVARLASGDTMVSSAVTALLAPLQWYRSHRIRALDVEDELMRRALEQRRLDPTGEGNSSGVSAVALALPLLVPLILAGELLAAAQRRSQLTAAEKADAEGMLLLKDPDSMVSALERCVRLDNVVTDAGQSLGDLFYCWTGDSTDDEDDPEWRRVGRLREVLGVWGWVADDEPATAAPPSAPRLGDEGP